MTITENAIQARSAAEAVADVRSGDRVFIGSGGATPLALIRALTDRADELRDVHIVHLLTMGEAPYAEPELADSFRLSVFFISANVRKAVQEGRADFIPVFLSEVPGLFGERCPIDWAFVQLSHPDRHGCCTTGISTDAVIGALRNARHIVAEINTQMPRTLGDTTVHIDRLHSFIEVDTPLPELLPREPTEVTERIGANVAALIRDGDCLQTGIGSIPNEVLRRLGDRRGLGIHTEMLTDGVVDLYETGAIDGKRKSVLPEKMVCTFALGSRKLYDFVDDNPAVSFHGCDFTNDPFVIAQNDNVVAINSAIQVDLSGQVDSDSFGDTLYSGIGGQVDFIRGAARSRGGRPIIVLPSTAKGGTVSRIVATLSHGAGVVTSRGDVHYVVTEYGVADLYAKGIHERARALIDICHPDFREDLIREAERKRLLR